MSRLSGDRNLSQECGFPSKAEGAIENPREAYYLLVELSFGVGQEPKK